MKPLLITSLLLTFFYTKAINIEDAFKKGLIKYDITGTTDGNTGSCIAVDITNQSTEIVNLEIETGRILEAIDTTYQDMIVTKRYFVRLQPKQKAIQNIYALCSKPDRSSPKPETKFSHGKMATGSLLTMAKFVENKNLQNGEGQTLIWNMVKGNYTLYNCDYTPQMYASLKTFFASDSKVKFENCNTVSRTSAGGTTYSIRRFKGSFGFSIPEPSDFELSLFDEDGNKVKELENKKQMQPDWYEYDYEFTNTGLTKGKTYQLKMLINGKPRKVIFIEN
jgi:hypothetical protein